MFSKTAAIVRRLRHSDWAETQRLFGSLVEFPAQARAGSRDRVFPPERTFWLFLCQVLSGNISCSEVVQQALAWLARQGAQAASSNTSGYCKARGRLSGQALEKIFQQTASDLEARSGPRSLWQGLRVRIFDGTGVSMPDTADNQQRFPQPRGQKKGCGFPVMRLVVMFSLATGAIVRVAYGRLALSERTLFHQMWEALTPGDVALCDRGFCSYADFWMLQARAVACVMRKNQRRSKGQRLVKRLGKGDSLVAWRKTGRCPKWLDRQTWSQMGEEITVREIDIAVDIRGFRTQRITVSTTLLDPQRFPKAAFADLYRRRWMAELFLRDIKISLRMDVLKCTAPERVLKELHMYLIAYNLIRAIMLQSAQQAGDDPLRLSFKRTADALRQWTPIIAAQDDPRQAQRLIERLRRAIAQLRIPYRPDRSEPRAVKRRRKNYQLMNRPRPLFKEIPDRNHYRAPLS